MASVTAHLGGSSEYTCTVTASASVEYNGDYATITITVSGELRDGYWVQSSGAMFSSTCDGQSKGNTSLIGNTEGGTKHSGTHTATHTYTVSRKTARTISWSVTVYNSYDMANKGTAGTLSGSISLTGSVSYYTVTFNLDGGTRTGGGALSQTVVRGGSATAPTCKKSGYTFTGWNKSLTNITANTTITAQWQLNSSYTITLDANGGTFSTSSLTYRSGIGIALPSAKPTKSIRVSFDYVISALTGYNSSTTVSLTFTGWNTKKDGTGTSYKPGATVDGTSNITLYAQYSGAVIALPGLTTNNVATTTGWWTKKTGGTKVTTSTKFTASTTLYAQYSDYTITLHGNGGVITLDESDSDPVDVVMIKKIHGTDLVIPNYTSYLTSGEDETNSTEFLGWAESRSSTKASYQKGSKYTKDEPTTLYAVYGTKTFTVKWSVGYGSNPIIKTETINYGAAATPPADPVRDGYTFAGWLGQYKSVKTDRTIIALWASTPIWIWNGKTWIGYEPEEV